MLQFLYQTLNKTRRRALARVPDDVTPAPAESSRSESFAAVAIRPGLIACAAVQAFGDGRMLEKDAPPLPVPGCDESQCRCRYVKFADRRSGEERRTQFGQWQSDNFRAAAHDNREKSDRRRKKERKKPRAYFNNYD